MKSGRQRAAQRAPVRDRDMDGDAVPLIVPRQDRDLVPVTPERVRRLRKYLVEFLRALAAPRGAVLTPADPPADQDGFAAQVVRAACALCQGSCCGDGGNHAYLDERAMARVAEARPELGARQIMRLYTERVPERAYEDSCIYHGEQGCTLDLLLRSQVCNHYFCHGLDRYLAQPDPEEPVVVIAGDGARMRRSKVLMPPGRRRR